MPKRTVKTLIVLAIAYCGYLVFSVVVGANRADIPVLSALFKTASCERDPSSQCFAELAILSLPTTHSFDSNNSEALALRYLGYGDVVDEAVTESYKPLAETHRNAQLLYESVSSDIGLFVSMSPIGDLQAYLVAYHLLQEDPSYFNTTTQGIGVAEDAARSRRGRLDTSTLTLALLRNWREGLDRYGKYGYQWLRYATPAREWEKPDEAEEALAKAEETGLHDISYLVAIVETLHLYGRNAAVEKIDGYPGTNLRAEAYLKLADFALGIGDTGWSSNAFAKFVENYDRREPIRHRAKWIHMPGQAARVAHALGYSEQAEDWADTYAKETSFYSISERVRYSGELYADIGLFAKSAAIAHQAITHAPALEKSFWSAIPGYEAGSNAAAHYFIVGRAVGLLCRAGEFETAYALTKGDPEYGRDAGPGCFAAIQDEDTLSRLSELESRLGELSKRPMRTAYAVSLVERGDYEQAALVIEQTLDLPPRYSYSARAIDNAQLLRLAVAMRDEPLTRTIMQSIARDANEVSGRRAVWLYAYVASFTKEWPDGGSDSPAS